MSYKIKPATETVETLKSSITVGEDGRLTIDNGVIDEYAKEKGMSLEDITKAQDIVNAVTMDIGRAMGEVAVDRLADDKSLETVEGGFDIGHSRTNMRVHRKQEVPASVGKTEDKSTKTVHGYTDFSTTTKVSDTHRTNTRKHIQGYGGVKLGGN